MTRYALAFLAAACMGTPAHAQQPPLCGPSVEIIPAFAAQYGETPLFTGLSASGFMLAIIINPESGTFSAFRVAADGMACLLDAGEGARLFAPEKPGEPS